MLLNLKELIKKYNLNIKGVIHIGAHFGEEFKTYKDLKINNLIFFEPISYTFERLKNTVGDDGILFNTALGNFTGQVEMYVETANQGQSSSILKPDKHLQQYPHIKFNSTEIVNIDKLDNFIEYKDNYNFINIDVQGYEMEVFKGGEEFLKNIDYVMTEVNRDEVYKDCAKVDEIDSFLSQFGFKRVETTWDGGIWGDGFYIKK